MTGSCSSVPVPASSAPSSSSRASRRGPGGRRATAPLSSPPVLPRFELRRDDPRPLPWSIGHGLVELKMKRNGDIKSFFGIMKQKQERLQPKSNLNLILIHLQSMH